jgi:tetratricopeptide (TPR) repeat protein
MHLRERTRFISVMLVVLSAAGWSGCDRASPPANSATASSNSGKVPITTKSEQARSEFLQGRDLSDKLRAQDSLPHFDKAIALDADFASAELERANSSPTAKEFFEHLNKAVSLADKASEGEKLLILANQAGANGEVTKQKDYLDKLVAAYPNDERAHFNLGTYYFGQQEMDPAILQFKQAAELAPNFSGTYNILGYAYRQQADYANAEQAFRKYIELIPGDPNPYDSYAELLLKMGKFDDSIGQYKKALSIDSNFFASHVGIAADLMYLGKPDEAVAELQKMAAQSRSDGELRIALFGMAVVAADRGKLDQAVQEIDKEYAVAAKKDDVAAMAADLQAKGNIFAQMPNYDQAQQQFDHSFEIIEASSLSQEIKDNAKLLHHFNMAEIALGKKDYAAARTHTEQFRQGAEASKNPAQVKQAHELAGRIALAEKHYDQAIAELQQANQQDPQNMYRLYQAHAGKGDSAKAQEYCTKAAAFNSLPQLNYAFVRAKARKVAGGNKA